MQELILSNEVPIRPGRFGTCKAQPEAGHEAMTIGIEQFREPADLRLDRMLLQPFRVRCGNCAINRTRKLRP